MAAIVVLVLGHVAPKRQIILGTPASMKAVDGHGCAGIDTLARDAARYRALLEAMNTKGDVHQLTHAGYTHANDNSVAQTQ